jgi:hypothetical protein
VVGEETERVATELVTHLVEVADDQHEWSARGLDRGDEPRHDLTHDRDPGRASLEPRGVDVEATADGVPDECQQPDRITVTRAQRHPHEGPFVLAGPLGEEAALAVAHRRRQHHERNLLLGQEQVHQLRTPDETRAHPWGMDRGVEQHVTDAVRHNIVRDGKIRAAGGSVLAGLVRRMHVSRPLDVAPPDSGADTASR